MGAENPIYPCRCAHFTTTGEWKKLFIVIFCAVDGAINKVREIEICHRRYGVQKSSLFQLDRFIFLDRYCTDWNRISNRKDEFDLSFWKHYLKQVFFTLSIRNCTFTHRSLLASPPWSQRPKLHAWARQALTVEDKPLQWLINQLVCFCKFISFSCPNRLLDDNPLWNFRISNLRAD